MFGKIALTRRLKNIALRQALETKCCTVPCVTTLDGTPEFLARVSARLMVLYVKR